MGMLAQKSHRGLRMVPERDLEAVMSCGRAEVKHDVELLVTFRGARGDSIPSRAGTSSTTGVPGPEVKFPGVAWPDMFCPKDGAAARLTQDRLPRFP